MNVSSANLFALPRVAAVLPSVLALCLAPLSTGAEEALLLRDDFEETSLWSLRTPRGAGTCDVSGNAPHGGGGCLECVADRGPLTLVRAVDVTERHTRVRFWFRPTYDASRLTDVSLDLTAASATDQQVYTVRLPEVVSGEWQTVDTDIARLSTCLVGDRVTSIRVSLSSRSGPLRLALDDFELVDETPEAPADALNPVPRAAESIAYRVPTKCTPRLRTALAEKLRVTEADDSAAFAALAAAGLNAVVIPMRDRTSVIADVGCAHEADLAALVACPLFRTGLTWGEHGRGRAAQFADSVGSDVVCPFDWQYWHTVVHPRLRQLMLLAQQIPLDGVLLDLNLHGAIHDSFADTSGCLCAHCMDVFVQANDLHRQTVQASPEERMAWLWKQGKVREFDEFQQRRLERRVRELVAETTPEDAPVMVGVMDYERHWTGDAVLNGILTVRNEALVLARAPCQRGYTLEVDRLLDRLARTDASVICVPGIDPRQVGLERLPWELFHLAMNSPGYWIALDRYRALSGTEERTLVAGLPELLSNCEAANVEIEARVEEASN